MATVQFDIDGVLADFMHGFTRLAQGMGLCKTITSSGQQAVWERYGDVPDEHVSTVWENAKASPWFWEDLPALVDYPVFRRIEALQGDHEVYFATSRVGRAVKLQTIRWLRWHGISWPTVVVTPKKGEVAAALGAGYAIDDKAGNAIFMGYQKGVRSYLLDAPYNRFDPSVVGSPVRRVRTVEEFITDVEEGK
jgi:uncharacterized HAD superfamily protein